MKTYFIILCWNNQTLLDECLGSIYKQTNSNYSIIMVDNGSSDDSVEYVRNNYPQVIVIEAGKNTGFAIGNNIGIKAALKHDDCAYIALLNTDAVLEKNWLNTLVKFAGNQPKGAGFQTPTLDYYNHDVLDSRGLTIDHAGRAIQLGYRDEYTPRQSHQIFGVNAAAALLSADFLRSQPFGDDFFDSDLWMYLEDVDIAARALALGWSNWYVDGSFSYHMGSVSSSKNPGFAVYHIYRNNGLLLLKNLPAPLLLKVIPRLIITDLITLFSTLRGRNIMICKKIIKARLVSITMFKRFLPKRRLLMKKRTVSNKDFWKLMQSTK